MARKNRFIEFTLPFGPEAHLESMIHPSGKFLYTPEAKKDYMKKIARALRDYKDYFLDSACLRMNVLFVCPRPDSNPSYIPAGIWKSQQTEYYKATRPDIDNYLKPLQDGMSNHVIAKLVDKKTKAIIRQVKGAGIIKDDSQIVSLRADKIYHQMGGKPQIEVKLEEVSIFYVRR